MMEAEAKAMPSFTIGVPLASMALQRDIETRSILHFGGTVE